MATRSVPSCPIRAVTVQGLRSRRGGAQVNPLAGCLPTLATIPVFIGLYRALSNVAEEGLLKEGFFWIPSLGGPTTLAAQKTVSCHLKSADHFAHAFGRGWGGGRRRSLRKPDSQIKQPCSRISPSSTSTGFS